MLNSLKLKKYFLLLLISLFIFRFGGLSTLLKNLINFRLMNWTTWICLTSSGKKNVTFLLFFVNGVYFSQNESLPCVNWIQKVCYRTYDVEFSVAPNVIKCSSCDS